MRCAYPAHSCTSSSSSIHPIFGSIFVFSPRCCYILALFTPWHAFQTINASRANRISHASAAQTQNKSFVCFERKKNEFTKVEFIRKETMMIMWCYAHTTTTMMSDDLAEDQCNDDVNHTHSISHSTCSIHCMIMRDEAERSISSSSCANVCCTIDSRWAQIKKRRHAHTYSVQQHCLKRFKLKRWNFWPAAIAQVPTNTHHSCQCIV